MILSDRSIREALAAGRIGIEPLDPEDVQPSSVDLHIDRYFRVFRNDTTPFIDPKEPQEDLTEIVEVKDGDAFILHPGEFVLGSTHERVTLPNDLVARLEGKSSLGRLGLLIHSSLPASETVLVRDDSGRLMPRQIGEIVAKRLSACVVAFDPESFAVDLHPITGWYEGPADRIFEVRLASGRSVRVTAGHNLFTLDRDGELSKVRTGELAAGTLVALPRRLPAADEAPPALRLNELIPEAGRSALTVSGPSVDHRFAVDGSLLDDLLADGGWRHTDYYRHVGRLPMPVAALVPGLLEGLDIADRVGVRGGRNQVPAVLDVGPETAWLLGIYVAEGSRRRNQLTISNTDQSILDRAQAELARWGLTVSRAANAVTCCSAVASDLMGWLGCGEYARGKRVPPVVFGWPTALVEAFLEGLVDGDGTREDFRTSVWTCSDGLVADLLLIAPRLGLRAAAPPRDPGGPTRRQISLARNENEGLARGDLLWDRVVAVVDTGVVEPVFDLEVRPGGHKVENFLAGAGGVFVSNTAGFVDAGWDGHLTLELSNVATLPIALYPGMKIGQISFFQMTTAAEHPYGSEQKGSKYQGQRGPTPSRYYLNFRDGNT